MVLREGFLLALLLALSGCATLGRTPALCAATVDVARDSVSGSGVRVSFVERDGAVTCSAEGAGRRICAAYEAEPPGAGLAPIGTALRSCLFGHGYIRTASRRDVRGERLIAEMRGGFRFYVTLNLSLDEDGRRYDLELDERVFLTDARDAPRAS